MKNSFLLLLVLCTVMLPLIANAGTQSGASGNSLTVTAPAAKPVITSQPRSITVDEGRKATFKVTADGATGYQWYYRTAPDSAWKKCASSDSSTAVHQTAAKLSYSGYQYSCLVRNGAESVRSKTVTLTVRSRPVITSQPKSITVNEDETASFRVAADNATGYQWYYRASASDTWKACAGSTGAAETRSIHAKAKYSGYQYCCLVRNGAETIRSKIVTLTVRPKPVITVQPGNLSVNEGRKATFKVTATGAGSYQWYCRPSAGEKWQMCVDASAAAAAYAFTAPATHDGYQYRCMITNSAGSVNTDIVTLTVHPKPVITVQPRSVTVNQGEEAAFTIKAVGATACHWYYRVSADASWKACTGSAAATEALSFTGKAKYSGYQFRCLLKNSAGSAYSNIVKLTVIVPASRVRLSSTEKTLYPGESFRLSAAVLPAAADQTVVWNSSDPAVAKVKDGKVTALASGSATITVQTADGSKTAECAVTVSKYDRSGLPYDSSLCLVCMGYQLNPNGSMRSELIGRLKACLQAANRYPNATIVCTGGATGGTNDTEGGQMANWLIGRGIDPGRILIENRSRSTQENAMNTMTMLGQQRPNVSHILIITSDYHMHTAVDCFRSYAFMGGRSIVVSAGNFYATW